MKKIFLFGIATVLMLTGSVLADGHLKNIILMVSDGAGYGAHDMTTYWHGAPEPYDNDLWTDLPTATYNLRRGGSMDPATGEFNSRLPPMDLTQDPDMVYDPAKAWDRTPVEGGSETYPDTYTAVNQGYEFLRNTAPDSAGTMGAMMTGDKVYIGGINVDGMGNPLKTAAEYAKEQGKMVGSVSTVRYNHATVAAGAGAHNWNRNNYLDLSYEMFGAGIADVVGGAGNPGFDDNGLPVDQATIDSRLGRPQGAEEGTPGTRFDAQLWDSLVAGEGMATRTTVDGREFTVDASQWELFQSKADIEALADGSLDVTDGKRLVMIPQVYGTFQYSRSGPGNDGEVGNNNQTPAFNDPFNVNIPSLADLTMASLHHMGDNEEGFFLAVESGATDWADHGDDTGRMIEEHTAFNDSVAAVIDYLDADTNGNNWENTLVIVTADHDHLTLGPESDTVENAFQAVTDNGAGVMPGFFHHTRSHSNQLIPSYFRGAGADDLASMADEEDTELGMYLDQTDIGLLLTQSLGAEPEAPASPCLFRDADGNVFDTICGDLDGDLSVGFLDFLILAQNFGQSFGGGESAASVPEPASAGLAMCAALGLLGLRRRR